MQGGRADRPDAAAGGSWVGSELHQPVPPFRTPGTGLRMVSRDRSKDFSEGTLAFFKHSCLALLPVLLTEWEMFYCPFPEEETEDPRGWGLLVPPARRDLRGKLNLGVFVPSAGLPSAGPRFLPVMRDQGEAATRSSWARESVVKGLFFLGDEEHAWLE